MIKAYCNASNVRKTEIVGTAYRIFKDDVLLLEERSAFKEPKSQLKKYYAMLEVLKGLVSEQANGNIPKESAIVIVGEEEVLQGINTNVYPEDIHEDVVLELQYMYKELLNNNTIQFERSTEETSHCGTEISQYLSKLAYVTALEFIKSYGKIRSSEQLLKMVNLQKELNPTTEAKFVVYETVDKSATKVLLPVTVDKSNTVLTNKDLLVYDMEFSKDFIKKWTAEVFSLDSSSELEAYFLFYAKSRNRCIKHIEGNKYLFKSNKILEMVFKDDKLYFESVDIVKQPAPPLPVRELTGYLQRTDFLTHDIVIDSHFIQRWQERISPSDSEEDILEYIKTSANINKGIKHECEKYYILQNDIVCVVSAKNEKIYFDTTYGRKSENPILNNLPLLSKTVDKYGKVILSYE